jgi:hypothetical protein
VFYLNADRVPNGGQDPIRRVLFNSGGSAKMLLQLIKEKTRVLIAPTSASAPDRTTASSC